MVAVACVVAEADSVAVVVAGCAEAGSAECVVAADSAVVVSAGVDFVVGSAGFVVGSTAAASDSVFRISATTRLSTDGPIPSGTIRIRLLTGIHTPTRMAEAAMDPAGLP